MSILSSIKNIEKNIEKSIEKKNNISDCSLNK